MQAYPDAGKFQSCQTKNRCFMKEHRFFDRRDQKYGRFYTTSSISPTSYNTRR